MNDLHNAANAQALATIRAAGEPEWVGTAQACRVLNVSREVLAEIVARCDVVFEDGAGRTGRMFYLPSLWDYNTERAQRVRDEQAAIKHAQLAARRRAA